MAPELEIVMPVYNEAGTLAETVRAIAATVAPLVPFRFVLAEDPGPDATSAVIAQLESELPILVDRAAERRGYSRAVRDGLRRTTAPFVLCIDSDGQFDPRDIATLWDARGRAEVVCGWRRRRAEGAARRAGSRLFGLAVHLLFGVTRRDASSPLVLMRRRALEEILPNVGALPEGLWWEFAVRAHQRGLTVLELPVRHYARHGSHTQVFRAVNIPGVVWRQGIGLLSMIARRPRVEKPSSKSDHVSD